MSLDKEELQKLEDLKRVLEEKGNFRGRAEKNHGEAKHPYDKVRKIEQREDPSSVEQEMGKRVESFQEAMKEPTKRLTPDPNVKHDARMVDTQGFNPKARFHVDDDGVEREEVEAPK